jgi:hypothetical protein
MQDLSNFNSEKLYSSIFLVEQINLFRKSEGNTKELLHFTLLAKIEKRFNSKIEDKKILVSSYLAKKRQTRKVLRTTL